MRYLLILAGFALGWPAYGTDAALPKREQCVVAYAMQWDSSRRPAAEVLNEMSVAPALASSVHLGGVTTPTSAIVYMQFTRSCSKRHAFAQRIVEEWRKVEGAPQFELITRQVSPGPSTIEISGPHWSH